MLSSECAEYSENDWKNLLDEVLSETNETYSIFTTKREFGKGAYYTCLFTIRTTSNNTDAVQSLINLSLQTDGTGIFTGSEIDINSGNLEVDFLYFIAKINIRNT